MREDQRRPENAKTRSVIDRCHEDQDLGRVALSLMAKIPIIERDVEDLQEDLLDLKRDYKEHSKNISDKIDFINEELRTQLDVILSIVKPVKKFCFYFAIFSILYFVVHALKLDIESIFSVLRVMKLVPI